MEVRTKELRIGNYLSHPEFGVIKVTGIAENSIMFKKKSAEWDEILALDSFKPIPLTISFITKKLGYKFSGNSGLYEHDIYPSIGITEFPTAHLFPYRKPCFKYRYLHRFQNFYFSYTGKELTLKDDEKT